MSKKSRGNSGRPVPRPGKQNQSSWLLLAALALGSIAIVAVVWFALTPNRGSGGVPQLQVSAERLDLGKQIFDRPVRASFTVKNDGDGALTLDVPPVATVLEGC
jgi:hypothetical protein